jgi:N-acetylneuraminic acid mutarotase
LSGRIFVLGGEGNPDGVQGIFSEVEAYDPVTDSWESFPQMLIPRHGYGAAIIGDRMYLAGGGTSQGFQATANHTVFYFAGSD